MSIVHQFSAIQHAVQTGSSAATGVGDKAQGTPTHHQQSNGLLSQANRSRCGQRRFSVAGALLWNTLPGEVRTTTRVPGFKHACVPYACRE